MTCEEQTAIARECCRLVRSDLSEDEQEAAAFLLGEEFCLTPDEALLQLAMSRVYLGPELELDGMDLNDAR
jgi:hypothetical protein